MGMFRTITSGCSIGMKYTLYHPYVSGKNHYVNRSLLFIHSKMNSQK